MGSLPKPNVSGCEVTSKIEVKHPEDPVAGGLWAVGGDADLLADEAIEQRGLAHVGTSDYRHGAATGVWVVHWFADRLRTRPSADAEPL